MRKTILRSLLIASVCGHAESIAVLDLKFIRDTGKAASVLCFDEVGTECESWSNFYVFEASLKKHISGKEIPEKFNLLLGRHALKKKSIRNIVVKIKEISDNEEATYQVSDIGFKGKVFCFENKSSGKLECYQ